MDANCLKQNKDELPRMHPEEAAAILRAKVKQHMFNQRPENQLVDPLVNDLFELALDARSESKRDIMRKLPKDKKIQIIRQITV